MMNYIRRIDEILLGPPYWLGNAGPPVRNFKAHWFLLPTDPTKLQTLLDQQLNAAFPNGPVRYLSVNNPFLFLVFLRYERAEAVNFPSAGWLAYTETLIGFVVRRIHENPILFPDEFVTYLGVVYIDDSKYKLPVDDPSSVPIVLGREAYGMPKNAGEIFYDPITAGGYPNPNCPKLELWDISTTNKLSLTPAIRVCDETASTPALPPSPPTLLGGGEAALPRPDFWVLARQFGIAGTDLRVEPMPALDAHAYRITLPAQFEQPPAIAYDNLQWRTKLVGLKQFPDPKVVGAACYQAAVESPLEEGTVKTLGPTSFPIQQLVEFPWVERVKLMDRFAIQPTPPWSDKVLVPLSNLVYEEGVLLYAKPADVNVWLPNP